MIGDHFEIAEDHYVTMDEMHRRIAVPCAVPAIGWHLSFWIPDHNDWVPDENEQLPERIKQESDSKKSAQTRRRDLWHAVVMKHLAILEDTFFGRKSKKVIRNINENPGLGEVRSINLKAHGREFSWRIKIESHFEHVSLTILLIVDRENQKYLGAGYEDFVRWPPALMPTYTEISSQLKKIIKSGRVNSEDKKIIDNLKEEFDKVFDEFWINLCTITFHSQKKFPGQLFADFRFCVLDLAHSNITYRGRAELPKAIDHATAIKAKGKLAKHILEDYQGTLKAINGDGDYREFIGCGMLDHRVIYATTLGAKFESGGSKPNDTNSVRYTLFCVDDPDRHQIGRLIERINTLGDARLASLRRIESIRQIGREVQEMGLELDKVSRDARGKIGKLEDFLFRLNNLGAAKDLWSEGRLRETITFRISRSLYYRDLIFTRLPDLRVQRVEEWQPYDEFLRRRLFPTLEFVEGVEKRIESLREKINSTIAIFNLRLERRQNHLIIGLTGVAVALGVVAGIFGYMAIEGLKFGWGSAADGGQIIGEDGAPGKGP